MILDQQQEPPPKPPFSGPLPASIGASRSVQRRTCGRRGELPYGQSSLTGTDRAPAEKCNLYSFCGWQPGPGLSVALC